MSDLITRRAAHRLRVGERFIFDQDLGGEGEILTVESTASMFGTITVWTKELDHTLDVGASTFLTLAGTP